MATEWLSILVVYPRLSYAIAYHHARVLYHVILTWENLKIQSMFSTECISLLPPPPKVDRSLS